MKIFFFGCRIFYLVCISFENQTNMQCHLIAKMSVLGTSCTDTMLPIWVIYFISFFLNMVFRTRDKFCLTNLSHKNALNRCWASLSLLGIIPQTRYEGAHIYTYIFGKMGFWISNRISIALSKSQVRRFTAAILKHRRHLSAIKIIRHFQLAHIINTNVRCFHKKKKNSPNCYDLIDG